MPNTTPASNDGRNKLDSQAKWAIIVVPGIFCSRLKDPIANETVWNVDSLSFIAGNFLRNKKTRARRMNPNKTFLRPQWEDFTSNNVLTGWRHSNPTNRLRRGYGTAAWKIVGDGLRALEKEFKDEAKVFVFGYDFRQDNWKSGGTLLEFIYHTVHGEFGIKYKPILVTHSMGGLVARAACCRFFNEETGEAVEHNTELKGEEMIAGIVHAMVPHYGTPAGYSPWRRGWRGGLGKLLGGYFGKNDSGPDFSAICYAMPSVYQLAPNHLYPAPPSSTRPFDTDVPDWLEFNSAVFENSSLARLKPSGGIDGIRASIPGWESAYDDIPAHNVTLSGHADKARNQRLDALEEINAALREYKNKPKPKSDDVNDLRKALLRYPYLLYRDKSGWLGIPNWTNLEKHKEGEDDTEDEKTVKRCIDLAEKFHVCRVGEYTHPKTWVLYSTKAAKGLISFALQIPDIHSMIPDFHSITDKVETLVTVKVTDDKGKPRVEIVTEHSGGDGTVTELSQAAFEGRAELQNANKECARVQAVEHVEAFKHEESLKQIVELVRSAFRELKVGTITLIGNSRDTSANHVGPARPSPSYKKNHFTVAVIWIKSDAKRKKLYETMSQRNEQDSVTDMRDVVRRRRLGLSDIYQPGSKYHLDTMPLTNRYLR